MESKKAKVSWQELCKPKSEGGLGFRNFREANKVSNLNLIWRLVSNQDSLWMKWIRSALLHGNSFWNTSHSRFSGSWTWRKLIKLRDEAKLFHKVEVHNGETTSFWFDTWYKDDTLIDDLGSRGRIDLGIHTNSTVGEAMDSHRHHRYRSDLHQQIVCEIQRLSSVRQHSIPDVHLWKISGNVYKPSFNSKSTWEAIRATSPKKDWHQGIWFQYATLKYSFISWMASLDRLSTGGNIRNWNTGHDTNCVFCSNTCETRDHLFFECNYSMTIWATTVSKLMMANYTCQWNHIIVCISGNFGTTTKTFLLRYAFQCSIYHIWRERNSRRHGGIPSPSQLLIKTIDKNVRNRLSSLTSQGITKHISGLQNWFLTR